jgi:hypothetical protein
VKKKIGIIVGGTAALLLAVSPLAFASDGGNDRSPDCSYSAEADNSVVQAGEGGEGAVAGGAVANAGAPVNGQANAPVLSCNTVEDVLDLNIEDNFQDNSTNSESVTETITDSFNTVED